MIKRKEKLRKYKKMLSTSNELIINEDGFRKDLDDYFKKYVFTFKKQESPFTVVVPSLHRVYCRKYTQDLFHKDLPDDATIFQAWPGKYRSDVFIFTIKQMHEWIEKQPLEVLQTLYVDQKLKGEKVNEN